MSNITKYGGDSVIDFGVDHSIFIISFAIFSSLCFHNAVAFLVNHIHKYSVRFTL